jgi:hypothetical protein
MVSGFVISPLERSLIASGDAKLIVRDLKSLLGCIAVFL